MHIMILAGITKAVGLPYCSIGLIVLGFEGNHVNSILVLPVALNAEMASPSCIITA